MQAKMWQKDEKLRQLKEIVQVRSSLRVQLWEQGCHDQGKVREKQKFFEVNDKSGNFV